MASSSQPGSNLPLRPSKSALKLDNDEPMSPKSGPVKVVSIAQPEEVALPPPSDENTRVKQFPASVGTRRRPLMPTTSSSRLSMISQTSIEEEPVMLPESVMGGSYMGTSTPGSLGKAHVQQQHDKLLLQVSEWLQREKARLAARKSKHSHKGGEQAEENAGTQTRTSSVSSTSDAISLEQLQRILEENKSGFGHDTLPQMSPSLRPRRGSQLGRRRSSVKRGGFASSDTEYQDGDVVVPSCDVVLDNSKTMSYSGGVAESSGTTVTLSSSKRAEKERQAWLTFKNEIVRLAHTLRLKGWRRVPLERGGDIEVERLSGALTNAVYVVSPPRDLPSTSTSSRPHPPPKLLLRIYGPQVEHLIDRENELGILRRLARKKIGPRLLGTFTNGRFEEFFNAQTLTSEDLRVEDTFKQIAKRMRELHDGIDLLERERDLGPFVWQNWDKWVGRCEQVITYLDKEILSGNKGKKEPWRTRGLVCGVEWKVFKNAIDKYRKWLGEQYRNSGHLKSSLVFAHNDTQYGNILRLIPEAPTPGSMPSPLLLPQNTHKQLIVIDFEYASANTPGLEFANHFTEWCYDYHSATHPFACNTTKYPTLDQQRAFIRSYVNHRPQFNPRASATPKMSAMDGTAAGAKGSISDFLLDARGGGSDFAEEEARREKDVERKVEELLAETRVWRVANSAQWVAWGIVQAKVPELDGNEADSSSSSSSSGESSPVLSSTNQPPNNLISDSNGVENTNASDATHEEQPENYSLPKRPEGLKAEALLQGSIPTPKEAETLDTEEDEFDYLGYAQDRAMFFWGDVVQLGIVRKEELPEGLWARLKVVGF